MTDQMRFTEIEPPEKFDIRSAMRPAFFVPATKPLRDLLHDFRVQKVHIAIVLDEYGGTAGLVTLGDVVAEIVGDVPDEHEVPGEAMRQVDEGVFEVPAALHVSDVNEALGLDIPEEEDYETLGGFVLAELGHFPRQGERFKRGEIEYAIVEASDRRVLRVAVCRSA